MLVVGLTGGIGSGKSEVARRLAGHGAVIVDADVVARAVVAPGTPGLQQVVDAFGAEVLGADGALDRERVAQRVFADPQARAQLNAIVHPLVGAAMLQQTVRAGEHDPHAVVVNDVPLLVENRLADRYDVVLVVTATPAVQLRRLVEQRGMTEADARARIAAQATDGERRAVADIVIDNDGDLAALDATVEQVWADLAARAGRTTLT